jgi:hypothetical protein
MAGPVQPGRNLCYEARQSRAGRITLPAAFSHRLATLPDLDSLRQLMDLAIGENQRPFLTPEQIASSRAIMGLDTQLIEGGT